jgi:hypothetical protein
MGRFYNNRWMSVNIIAATNTGNNRRTAVSMRPPVNTFPLNNVVIIANLLLWDTRCAWLLDYETILNGRGFERGSRRGYVTRVVTCRIGVILCGGGVEYLHRSPASRRRRQKEMYRIWGSKIWSRVPRDSDPKMTALARPSSNCKRQPRPLVRESAPHQQTRTCLKVIKIWS